MFGCFITRTLLKARAQARRFASADQGNIAMIFGIAIIPIITFIGAAIDYSRANAARSSMQAAIDSTALMISRDLAQGTITPSDITTKAQAYFGALYTAKEALQPQISATYTSNATVGSTVLVNGSAHIKTDFMQVVGLPDTIGFSASSTSAWGNARLRVAMALDNTGSMAADGKMPALQTAAKSLIDQLSVLAKTNGDVYISIIPFSTDVHVGVSSPIQSWVDFTAWDADDPTNFHCVGANKNSKNSCISNGGTWVLNDHSTWNGCVWDRDKDALPVPGYDVLVTPPDTSNKSTLFQAHQASGCPVRLKALSFDWTSLKNRIDQMSPGGSTNQAIGLAWAWQSLMSTDPLNAPAKDPSPNYTYQDAIILLSDGLNTVDRWYSDAASIDARQKILCDNAKAAGVVIYTIQVNTGSPGDPTSDILKYCASGPNNFYEIKSASQTVSVFSTIGTALAKLRVAK